MIQNYIQFPEQYGYKYDTLKQFMKECKKQKRRRKSWQIVLFLARQIIHQQGLSNNIRIIRASPKFKRQLPNIIAGIYKDRYRKVDFIIALAPSIRYLHKDELNYILNHEIEHFKKGDI